jgi:hypothetical protein
MDTWEFYLDYVRQSDNLSEDEMKEVLDGVTKLRQVFNDNWLRQARQEHHPLVSYVLSKAPWSQQSQLWLADFGRKLDALKRLPKFKRLQKRLRSSREYLGAEAEAEIAAKITAAGITDIELYPNVMVKDKQKEPDLRAIVDGEDIYFEVATLGEPGECIVASQTYQELTSPFDSPETRRELLFFCQIHKIPQKLRVQELKTKIQIAIAEVKETRKYAYIGEPGVLDCLVIPRSKQEECDALIKSFGMKREISGPPVEVDDVGRIKSRLGEKSDQLPQDRPGVIIVFGSLIYFSSPEHFYEDLVNQVEETIRDQDNLVLGVIIDKTGRLGQVSKVDEKPNYIVVTKSRNLLQETVIIIRNRYSKFAVNEKILSAFAS